MGPLFFRAENAVEIVREELLGQASMGPLFFRAENSTSYWMQSRVSGVLQWGRSFSERRTRHRATAATVTPASMGPLFFRAENTVPRLRYAPRPCASMGPLFFRAENEDRAGGPAGSLAASMGPLFFRAENDARRPTWLAGLSLQWGRSFSERRTLI